MTHIGNPGASDVYAQFIPWHAAVREAIRQHQWPLWNPFELCGNILAAAVQSSPYHPLHLVSLLLPLPSALTFIASMVFFLAAVSMFLFVRPLVSTDAAALLAGAIWMLAPHVGGFALTAYARAEDRVRIQASGFGFHLSKPVDPMTFVRTVREAAGR